MKREEEVERQKQGGGVTWSRIESVLLEAEFDNVTLIMQ